MRIVGGTWRGKSIEAPEGRGTRPTTDRMRESLASSVLSAFDLDLSNVCVLDAFAGSGGVGLELLSRGAHHCTFCERDRKAAGLIRKNCKSVGAPAASYSILCKDAFSLAITPDDTGVPYDLVFLDPPYALPVSEVASFVEGLDQAGCLSQRCLVVYERSRDGAPLECPDFSVIRSKRHGATSIDMLQKGVVQ